MGTIKRTLISITDDGGIITVRYIERMTRTADEFFRDCDEADFENAQRQVSESVLRSLPDSQELMIHTARYAVVNMLYECGPMSMAQLRKALHTVTDATFKRAICRLLAEGTIYPDGGNTLRINAEWLEGYISKFMDMPKRGDK